MIIKQLTTNNNRKYLIGFKEIKASTGTLLECHILKKCLFGKRSIFKKSRLKGLYSDYHQMAIFTIIDYERECKQQEKLLSAVWS